MRMASSYSAELSAQTGVPITDQYIHYISCLEDSTGESTDNNWENSENVKFE